MGDADPFANDPYDRLGVSKSDSFQTIKSEAEQVMQEYMQKAQNASSQSEKDRYTDAFDNLQDAFEEIEQQKQDAGPSRRVLDASANPATVELGEKTEINVKDDKGNKVEACSLKIDGRRRGRTDANGTESIEPRNTGTVTVDVEKDPVGGVSYKDTTVELNVEKKQTALRFADPPDRVDSGDQVTLTVENEDGIEIRDAEVTAPTESATTNGSGEATVTITGDGQVTITVTRAKSSTTKYTDAQTSIEVDPRTVPLSFKSAPTRASVDDTIAFTVFVDGNPIQSAQVTVDGDSATTGSRGRAHVTLSSAMPGKQTANVTKSDDPGVTYTDDQTKLKISKADVDMSLTLAESTPTVDDTVRVSVTDQHSNGIEDARLAVDGDEEVRTGSSGDAQISFGTGGKTTVSATKPDDKRKNYHSEQITVDVERHVKNLQLRNVPAHATTGEAIDVIVEQDNGQAVSEAKVKTEGGDSDTTGRGGSATVEFTVAGSRKLTAEKSPDKKTRYNSAKEHVSVEKPQRSLKIVESPDEAQQNDSIRVRVKDTHRNSISGALIRTSSNDRTRTGEDGWATVQLSGTGIVRIVASVDDPDFDDVASVNIWVDP